ncbi:hypothetical protein AHAS_Ahas05G0164300 [Arachis hypogaea]
MTQVLWHATPLSQSGTPRPFFTSSCFWKLVPAWHAQGLACHAPLNASSSFWRAMPHHLSGTPSSFGPLSPPLENTTSVSRHETGVPRPSLALVPKVGVPRLDVQVACQSGTIELACHTFDTKWHAQLCLASFSAGVPRLII